MKPLIGIVSKHYQANNGRQNTFIRDEVKNAVLDNGGIAIAILPTETAVNYTNGDLCEDFLTEEQKQDLFKQINLCDGIILQGGKDSDKYESFAAKYTFDNDIPTLGLCAGQNAMVRGVGGTTKFVEDIEKHHQMWNDEVHYIFIEKNSKFFDIVGTEKMVVNSRHKKTIDNPTQNYFVSAKDEDGNFDVVEAPNKKFNIALRFHPESLYKTHPLHNKIFEAFISACKN